MTPASDWCLMRVRSRWHRESSGNAGDGLGSHWTVGCRLDLDNEAAYEQLLPSPAQTATKETVGDSLTHAPATWNIQHSTAVYCGSALNEIGPVDN